MNAFVKTTKGNFPNQNFYLAWKGFDEMKYEVIKFEEEDLNNDSFWMSCSRNTPVFAGVTVFDKIMKKLGVIYNKIDTYPTILQPYMNRNVEKSTIGEFRKRWDESEDIRPQLFMKPVEQKKFNGAVMMSILDWIPLVNVPNDTAVYIVDPVNFESEFRVYIHDQEIISAKHYMGDWSKVIDKSIVKDAIKTFELEAPCAYSLDFGVTDDGKTTLIEFNDATSLGNYGLNTIHYAEMLADRWFEIVANNQITDYVNKEIEDTKKFYTNHPFCLNDRTVEQCVKETNDMYNTHCEGIGSWKNLLVKRKIKDIKIENIKGLI